MYLAWSNSGASCAKCYNEQPGDLGVNCSVAGARPQLLPGFHSEPLAERQVGNTTAHSLAETRVFYCSLHGPSGGRVCPGGDFGTCSVYGKGGTRQGALDERSYACGRCRDGYALPSRATTMVGVCEPCLPPFDGGGQHYGLVIGAVVLSPVLVLRSAVRDSRTKHVKVVQKAHVGILFGAMQSLQVCGARPCSGSVRVGALTIVF